MITRTCDCREHRGGGPRVIDGHTYELDVDAFGEPVNGVARWRYLCSCGSRGAWTYQSDNVPYHSWLRHVAKKRRTRS